MLLRDSDQDIHPGTAILPLKTTSTSQKHLLLPQQPNATNSAKELTLF